ncbi:MAG: type II toxin-antitoxin system RelE/ParE family toxin [Vicinamibacterales bacterium]
MARRTSPGLGWSVVRRRGRGTFALIESFPEVGSPRRGRLPSRQLKVRGFPYIVAYRIRPADIYIVAVAHTSRRPGYWKHRA